MRRKMIVFLLIAFTCINTLGQNLSKDSRIDVAVVLRDIVKKETNVNDEYRVYYTLVFRNNTNATIDSLFGAIEVKNEGKFLGFINFNSFEPISGGGIVSEIVSENYNIPKDGIFSEAELKDSKTHIEKLKTIINTDLAALDLSVIYLTACLKNGVKIEIK